MVMKMTMCSEDELMSHVENFVNCLTFDVLKSMSNDFHALSGPLSNAKEHDVKIRKRN